MKLDDKMKGACMVCAVLGLFQFLLGYGLDSLIFTILGIVFYGIAILICIPGMIGVYFDHDWKNR